MFDVLDVPAGTALACATAEPDLFFAESPADVERAKALCAGCPRQRACLTGALQRAEPWGVWGGQLLADGVIVPRKRPRGRPRKADLARDEELAAALALEREALLAEPGDDGLAA